MVLLFPFGVGGPVPYGTIILMWFTEVLLLFFTLGSGVVYLGNISLTDPRSWPVYASRHSQPPELSEPAQISNRIVLGPNLPADRTASSLVCIGSNQTVPVINPLHRPDRASSCLFFRRLQPDRTLSCPWPELPDWDSLLSYWFIARLGWVIVFCSIPG